MKAYAQSKQYHIIVESRVDLTWVRILKIDVTQLGLPAKLMQKYWLSGPISNRVSKHWLGSLADKLRAVGPKRGKLLWNMSEVLELDSYLRTNKTVMNLTRPNKHDVCYM